MQHALAQLARHGAIGERDRTAVGELEGADIERIGAAMFGELCACDAVAAAAFVGVEIIEIGDGAAEAGRERRDIVADPFGQRGRHGTAQDGRRLHRNPPLVRQHDRLQPHQVLAAAATGAMDIGNAGRNGDGVGQRQPAGRRLRRRLRCGAGLILGLILGLLSGLGSGPCSFAAGGPGSVDGASAGRGCGSGSGAAARRTALPAISAALSLKRSAHGAAR